MQKVFTRSVTLLRADSLSAAVKPSSISAPNVEAEDLFPSAVTNSTQFEVLGQPSLIARASTQRSVPLLVRRGCLVSLFSSSNLDSISMSHQWIQPWSKLLRYGSLKSAIFHKLDSGEPFHCLIAPNTSSSSILFRLGLQSSSLRTVCPLTLDGTSDWFVLGKNSILAYEDNGSLCVSDAPLRLPTKKHRWCIGSKYQQLQGRGNALVSAPGTIYKIDLIDESEEIIIKARNLLAVNGINPLEIKESIERFDLHPPVKAPSKPAVVGPTVLGKYTNINWTTVNATLVHAKNVALYWLKHLYIRLVRGSNVYIKVKGPRTLLVNSSYAAFAPIIPEKYAHDCEDANASEVEILPRSNLSESSEPKNYLSYAIMDKGKITFHSTPDFSDTIKRIKAKMN